MKRILILVFLISGCTPSIQQACANAYNFDQCVQDESVRRQQNAMIAMQYMSSQPQPTPFYYAPTNAPVNTTCNGVGNNFNCTTFR